MCSAGVCHELICTQKLWTSARSLPLKMEITTKLPAPVSPSTTIACMIVRLFRVILLTILFYICILMMRYNEDYITTIADNHNILTTVLQRSASVILHTLQSNYPTTNDDSIMISSTLLATLEMMKEWIPRTAAFLLTGYLGVVYGYVGLCQLGVVLPFWSTN